MPGKAAGGRAKKRAETLAWMSAPKIPAHMAIPQKICKNFVRLFARDFWHAKNSETNEEDAMKIYIYSGGEKLVDRKSVV